MLRARRFEEARQNLQLALNALPRLSEAHSLEEEARIRHAVAAIKEADMHIRLAAEEAWRRSRP